MLMERRRAAALGEIQRFEAEWPKIAARGEGATRKPDPNADALEAQLPRLRPVSGLHATGYRVSCLYLDDPQLDGYGKRMADLPIRNRVRIRTYGEVGQPAPVFLEAKRKLYGRVVKARMRVCDTVGWAELGAPAPWRDLHARVTPALRQPVAR